MAVRGDRRHLARIIPILARGLGLGEVEQAHPAALETDGEEGAVREEGGRGGSPQPGRHVDRAELAALVDVDQRDHGPARHRLACDGKPRAGHGQRIEGTGVARADRGAQHGAGGAIRIPQAHGLVVGDGDEAAALHGGDAVDHRRMHARFDAQVERVARLRRCRGDKEGEKRPGEGAARSSGTDAAAHGHPAQFMLKAVWESFCATLTSLP